MSNKYIGPDGKEYTAPYESFTDSTDKGADKTLLSAAGQAVIAQAQEKWKKANAAGDQAGMDAAHAEAEAVREKAGYSGGDNGGAYNVIATPSAGGGSGSGRGTVGSGIGEKFSYETAPSYVNKYQSQIDALTRQILERAAFEYDPESDPTYQQYKESYTRNGERAMQDTMGQVSARTGGLASSYAASAAQQTYDGYMGALADKIPELRQLAYEMYRDEGADMRSNLEMLLALEQGDYSKYQGLLDQYNTDRGFDYGMHRDEVGDQQWRESFDREVFESDRAYQYEQDAGRAALLAAAGDYSGYAALWDLTEEQTQTLVDEYARQKKLTEEQAARELADFYAQYGDFSKLKELGVNTSYAEKMQSYELQQAAVSAAGKSSGSGSSSRKSSGSDTSGGTSWALVEDWVDRFGEDEAENYVKEHYNDLGYSSQSAALAGWKNHLLEVEEYNSAASYDSLKNRVEHINPGVTDTQMASLYREIAKARQVGKITQAEYDALGKMLGF